MKNSNTPAYPQSNHEIVKAFLEVEEVSPNGLSKREAFAMAAMQGCCANNAYITESWKEVIVKESVLIADKLLAELEK